MALFRDIVFLDVEPTIKHFEHLFFKTKKEFPGGCSQHGKTCWFVNMKVQKILRCGMFSIDVGILGGFMFCLTGKQAMGT